MRCNSESCSENGRLTVRGLIQARKELKDRLSGLDKFWWGGGLSREGVGFKKVGMSICLSLETLGNQTFWRELPGNLSGYCLGCSKSLRTESVCSTSFPGF